ncbi:hypothetical protein B0H13DRAFT_1850569 [Mycena leptocephala]|nr:hypothetical protein B0H13DRAFT_1850569 [Mycena leptocephala]
MQLSVSLEFTLFTSAHVAFAGLHIVLSRAESPNKPNIYESFLFPGPYHLAALVREGFGRLLQVAWLNGLYPLAEFEFGLAGVAGVAWAWVSPRIPRWGPASTHNSNEILSLFAYSPSNYYIWLHYNHLAEFSRWYRYGTRQCIYITLTVIADEVSQLLARFAGFSPSMTRSPLRLAAVGSVTAMALVGREGDEWLRWKISMCTTNTLDFASAKGSDANMASSATAPTASSSAAKVIGFFDRQRPGCLGGLASKLPSPCTLRANRQFVQAGVDHRQVEYMPVDFCSECKTGWPVTAEVVACCRPPIQHRPRRYR